MLAAPEPEAHCNATWVSVRWKMKLRVMCSDLKYRLGRVMARMLPRARIQMHSRPTACRRHQGLHQSWFAEVVEAY